MTSKQEMKQVSLLVSRHSHQILLFKLSTYDIKSIKLQEKLPYSSKDTIFTIPFRGEQYFYSLFIPETLNNNPILCILILSHNDNWKGIDFNGVKG